MSLTMRIDKALAEAALSSLVHRIDNLAPFYKTWARMVVREAQRNARKHSKGGSFWASIADAVRLARIDGAGATIVCDHYAARHKHFGGTISAPGKGPGSRNASRLAIPVHELARGRNPSELAMDGVKLFRSPSGRALMAQLAGSDEPVTLYALARSVTQKAEPWWPSTAFVIDAGIKEAQYHLSKVQ